MHNQEKWDQYFFSIAKAVAKNSKCLSRQIGAVLVKDGSIISTGYNGPPRGVPSCDVRAINYVDLVQDIKLYDALVDQGLDPHKVRESKECPRYVLGFKSGEGLEWCPAGHAERNALIQAARNGICTKDTTLYMDCPLPCSPCLVEIINAGVEMIVCTDERGYYDISAQWLVQRSAIKTRTFSKTTINSI